MNLYLLSQNKINGYDTYDSCVVAADTPEDAALISPDGSELGGPGGSWCRSPKDVIVEYLGAAKEGTEQGVILASFNAG